MLWKRVSVVAAGAAVCAAGSVAWAQSRYVSPGGFSLTVPAGFQRDDAKAIGTRVLFMGPKTRKFTANILVSLGESTDMTVDKLVQGFKDNDVKSGEAKLVSEKRLTVGGVPAAILKSRRKITPEIEIVQTQFLAMKGKRIALLSMSADISADRATAPTYEGVIKSFAWK